MKQLIMNTNPDTLAHLTREGQMKPTCGSMFICPECHGSVWQAPDGMWLCLWCQMGRAFFHQFKKRPEEQAMADNNATTAWSDGNELVKP